ncbi:hypothetical protein Pfo_028249 [Paulownia fortunei]|nr:hypothetical protein Pfo_028249 [Paulownia fortunei]
MEQLSHNPTYVPQNNLMNENYERIFLEPMPPGFKFRPTDIELIQVYLNHKLQNGSFPPGFQKLFLDVKLYHHKPQDLIGMCEELEKNQESWYFFTPRERKYQNGSRPQRSAGNGYWKATGKDKPVVHNGDVIGYKKVLDFYTGRHHGGDKTEWKMHEYLTKEQKDHPNIPSTSQNPMQLNDCVLCKIYKNRRSGKRKYEDDADEHEGGGEDHVDDRSNNDTADEQEGLQQENLNTDAKNENLENNFDSNNEFMILPDEFWSP